MEEASNCPICFVRRKNVLFSCGHGTCESCKSLATAGIEPRSRNSLDTALSTMLSQGNQLTGYELTSYHSKIVVLKNNELLSPRQTADEGEPGPRTKEERSPEDEITKERLENLEKRIAEMEEATNCPICFVRRKNVVFSCGHGTCENCGKTLKICPICRKTIRKRTKFY